MFSILLFFVKVKLGYNFHLICVLVVLAEEAETSRLTAAHSKERAMFDRIRDNVSRTQWNQILNALNLFSRNIVTRSEMVGMVDDILGPAVDLLDKFKKAIGFDEWEQKQTDNRNNYYAFVHMVDPTSCKQVTPSYRQLPGSILIPPCSGRTRLCEEVLNDVAVSIPTGSEDKSFKSTRKNIYEENLFKCEDERFELDMLIENNLSAINVLKPTMDKLAEITSEEAKRLRLTNLDILHVRAIARLYEDHGFEIVKYLQESPAVAVPVVLARLQQKDQEWRQVKAEMKSSWRKVNQQNYHRSLDHRSFYFKQEDKKRRTTKVLVGDLRELHLALFCTPASSLQCLSGGSKVSGKEEAQLLKNSVTNASKPDSQFLKTSAAKSSSNQPFPSSTLSIPAFAGPGSKSVNKVESSSTPALPQLPKSNLSSPVPLQHATPVGTFSSITSPDSTINSDDSLWQSVRTAAGHDIKRPSRIPSPDDPFYSYSYAYNFEDQDTHKLLLQVVARVAGKMMSEADLKKLTWWWHRFLHPFFGVDDSVTVEALGPVDVSLPVGTTGIDPSVLTEPEPEQKAAPRNSRKRGRKQPRKRAKPNRSTSGNVDATAGGRSPAMSENEHDDPEHEQSEHDETEGENKENAAASNSAEAGNGMSGLDLLFSARNGDDSASTAATRRGFGHVMQLFEKESKESPQDFKPLNVSSDQFKSQERLRPMRAHTRSSKLFFGNSAFYIFFRLHQFLYERLFTALQLVKYSADSQVAHGANSNNGSSSSLSNSSSSVGGTDVEDRKAAADHDTDVHARTQQKFFSLLFMLLDGEREASKFEDQCRSLLGGGAFVLFTVDKLTVQLIKQVMHILASDNCMQLLALYHYEGLRAGARQAPTNAKSIQLARMYHTNASALINPQDEEGLCVQVEFFDDSKELGVGLNDPIYITQPIPEDNVFEGLLPNPLSTPKDGNATQFRDADEPAVCLVRNILSTTKVHAASSQSDFIKQNNSEFQLGDGKLVHRPGQGDILVRTRRSYTQAKQKQLFSQKSKTLANFIQVQLGKNTIDSVKNISELYPAPVKPEVETEVPATSDSTAMEVSEDDSGSANGTPGISAELLAATASNAN